MSTTPSKVTAGRSDERRRSVRLKGRKEAILIQPNGVHHILDLSLTGLSFRCIEDEVLAPELPIDILFAGTPLYMTGVTVRLVHENMNDMISFISTPTKEIGVEFIDLDEKNLGLLNRLISYLAEDTTN